MNSPLLRAPAGAWLSILLAGATLHAQPAPALHDPHMDSVKEPEEK